MIVSEGPEESQEPARHRRCGTLPPIASGEVSGAPLEVGTPAAHLAYNQPDVR
jgi:hypothetical protein